MYYSIYLHVIEYYKKGERQIYTPVLILKGPWENYIIVQTLHLSTGLLFTYHIDKLVNKKLQKPILAVFENNIRIVKRDTICESSIILATIGTINDNSVLSNINIIGVLTNKKTYSPFLNLNETWHLAMQNTFIDINSCNLLQSYKFFKNPFPIIHIVDHNDSNQEKSNPQTNKFILKSVELNDEILSDEELTIEVEKLLKEWS